MTTTTSTQTPITNSICALCPRALTVKLKTRAGYVCPDCYRTKVMSASKTVPQIPGVGR